MSSMPPRIPFSPSSSFAATFQVTGMTCDHCVRAVTAEVSQIHGVTSVYVDLSGGAVTVASRQPIDNAAVAAALDEAGYTLA
jgi:copper chaperone